MSDHNRQVQVFKYVKDESKEPRKDICGHYSQPQILVPDRVGMFKCFAQDYEELNNGVGTYPCMVVEFDDGKVEHFPLHIVKFIVRAD